ncbi:MAG: GNAT family N-acetyltransferase [Bacilli bacterium]|jgi:predicted GNAT family N-acyltransferase
MKINFKEQVGIFKDAKDIRQKVFVEEQGFIVDIDELDKTSVEIVMYDDKTPIGTCRIIDYKPGVVKIGRFAIIKEYREHGLAKLMLKEAENVAVKKKAQIVLIDSQYDKKKFYMHHGYRALKKRIFLDENYPHIRLLKTFMEKS